MNRQVYLLFLTLFYAAASHASILLQGDSAAPVDNTFSFPIAAHATSMSSGTFYVGAQADGAEGFSLARVAQNARQFFPLAPQNVTLNYNNGSNPIYNKGIQLLTILSAEQGSGRVDRVVVVTTDPAQRANLYLVEQVSERSPISVLSVENVRDATGAITTGIVGISATRGGRSGVFAAVKPGAGGNFGDVGSGVALVDLAQVTLKQGDKEISRLIFNQLPAQVESTALRAAALDVTSSFIKVGNNLASMTNVVDVYWDDKLQRLFVAIQGTAGAAATDGLRAVAVGRVEKDKLIFESIAPASILTTGANNEIIAGQSSSTQVSLHKVRVMHTSTHLAYLIAVGGNGAPSSTARSVFAEPLVNEGSKEAFVGVLANKNQEPKTFFKNGDPAALDGRVLTEPATTSSEIFTATDFQAQVGGGPLSAGNIVDLMVVKDTVFAVVGEGADATQQGGIFYSQALFDAQGMIKNWTQWRRVAGVAEPLFGMSYDASRASFTFMAGADATHVQTVRLTVWSTGAENELKSMGTLLSVELPHTAGGIQGVFDFPVDITPGVSNMSILAATGFNKVVLIETGKRNPGGPFLPNGGPEFISNSQTFTQGKISPAANAQTLIIEGGALDKIAATVTAEIGVAGGNGYLFAGGSGGLAVLAHANGTGWDAVTGLQPSFIGLTEGMQFRHIGEYTFVRALIADGDFLYVLTDTVFDRINMATSNFGETSTLVATRLADSTTPGFSTGAFLDALVSEKFALVSTTTGLFRVGNDRDIRTALSPEEVGWTVVPINEAAGSVTQLYPFSVTGKIQDVARSHGSNIYALNGYVGQSRGQVNRLSVADVVGSPISNTTVQAVPDIRVEGRPSFFKSFGGIANQSATDGSVLFYTRCRNLNQPLFFKSSQASTLPIQDLTISLGTGTLANISRVLRSSASGSWMVAGDFVRFNE